MNALSAPFIQDFIQTAEDGWQKGWHERNGGNLSYRLTQEDLTLIDGCLREGEPWQDIGAQVPGLRGEYFLITGSGKFFRNVARKPEECLAIIQLDEKGERYRLCWGLCKGGRPTSELPTHLMNHEVKKARTEGRHRVIYHYHGANAIALTFALPLTDEVFTRELWETFTECPVFFPSGVGVVGWMVPGGQEIALATAKLMERYDIVFWAHHGVFCSAEDLNEAFGQADLIEKACQVLVKVYSMRPQRLQTIQPEDFRKLARSFQVELPERFLYDRKKGERNP